MPVKLAPKVAVPGRGPGRNVPNNVLIGRQPGVGGRGPLQILDLLALKGMGLATAKSVGNQLNQAGFTFNAGGLLGNDEDLGEGTWGHAVTFTNGVAGSSVVAQYAATGTAVFDITAIISGVPTVFGTITFSAGGTVGVVNFPALFVIPLGGIVRLNAPSPADATLASVSGVVMGFAS
jgi:hypothetical protein